MLYSGFFNGKNHDKKYYASDLSRLFSALITPGIFENIGDKFVAHADTGMNVIIPTGISYINNTWSFNDSDLIITVDEAPYVAGFKRIDGIFIRSFPVDDTVFRDNEIYYMKGTETSQTPSKPVPTPEAGEIFTPICYISVEYETTSITDSMIENAIGTEDAPFITGILETVNISDLLTQWSAQWNEWLSNTRNTATNDLDALTAAYATQWQNWFSGVVNDLSSVDVGELYNTIEKLFGIYVQDQKLYMPNTGASVTEDGTLVIGSSDSENPRDGGHVRTVIVGGVSYEITENQFMFDTYQDYQDAYNQGEIPAGSVVFIDESGSQAGVNTISASQVGYGNTSVGATLDSMQSQLLKNWTKVWENPSKYSNFAAQNIDLDLSGYTEIYIACGTTTTQNTYMTGGMLPNIEGIGTNIYGTHASQVRCRAFRIISTGIEVQAGYSADTVSAGQIIPHYIYAR